jgi:phage baseplate assembly protein W
MLIQTRKYNDIDIAFGRNLVTKDVGTKTYEDSVKQSIKTLVMMERYEKPFHPEIHCSVRSYLFELASPITATVIAKAIEICIKAYEPRVVLNTVDVFASTDLETYQVTLVYSILNDPSPVNIQELEFLLERIR